MKNFILSSRFLVGITGAALVGVIGFSLLSQTSATKQSALYQASNALGICFQRVNQTFTALMIRDFSSNYMQKNFQSVTGECLSELANSVEKTLGVSSLAMTKMNNLMSDVHWFDEKVDRLAKLAQNNEADIYQSNVIDKYVELEGLKSEIDEQIVQSAQVVNSREAWVFAALILSQIIMIFSFISLFIKRKILNKEIKEIEEFVTKTSFETKESVMAQTLLSKLIKTLEVNNAARFLMGYFQKIEEENFNIKDQLIKANTIGYSEKIEVEKVPSITEVKSSFSNCDFNESLGVALDRIQSFAFNHGIILDTEVESEFYVKSNQEALNQMLYSIISFAMESSLSHNQGRKVIVKGKPLGGIAFCKIKIAGYSFSESDIAVLNGAEATAATNTNLLILKELISDTNGKIAVKNKHNAELGVIESELELIFDRGYKTNIEFKPKEVQAVVKGNKKQIRDYFNTQLNETL